jgi:hypothetical protein
MGMGGMGMIGESDELIAILVASARTARKRA